jgi:hypothetical protein
VVPRITGEVEVIPLTHLTDAQYALDWNLPGGTGDLFRFVNIVTPSLPGDFNDDGFVDAADYVVWRKTDSGNSQGYTDWRKNFGGGMGSGSAGVSHPQTSAPEPAILVLLMFGAAGWNLRRVQAA